MQILTIAVISAALLATSFVDALSLKQNPFLTAPVIPKVAPKFSGQWITWGKGDILFTNKQDADKICEGSTNVIAGQKMIPTNTYTEYAVVTMEGLMYMYGQGRMSNNVLADLIKNSGPELTDASKQADRKMFMNSFLVTDKTGLKYDVTYSCKGKIIEDYLFNYLQWFKSNI